MHSSAGGSELRGAVEDLARGSIKKAVVDKFPRHIQVLPPSSSCRERFFSPFFDALPTLPLTLLSARRNMFSARNRQLKLSYDEPPEDESSSNPRGDYVAPISEKDRERDRHYFREQRLFFRAALGQLFKDRRFSCLYRPVDPEQVMKTSLLAALSFINNGCLGS